ncbi:MAG: TetR/AcrR family transcriptional regulator [Planctomycetota bacterium]
MPAPDTKTTILDAAESLFAEHGFAATSLRELTARAGANLAAVNYHFGSKDDLAVAVLTRRIGPVNAERRARLDALGQRATVEAIVRAFLEPVLRLANGPADRGTAPGGGFCRLFGRLMVEQPPFLRPFVAAQFRDLGHRFAAMLQQALPGEQPATLWWRLHFLVGAMAHTLQNAATLTHLTGGLCRHDDVEEVIEQLVRFGVGGFTGASTRPRRRSRPTNRRKVRR